MLALQHGLEVVAEEQLAVGVVFRADDIDGLVGVDGGKAAFGQFPGKAGADDLGAVQADDGVDDGAGDVFLGQLSGHRLGVAQASLEGGDVDVIVDVAVVGGKVPLGHLQRHRAAAGIDLLHTLFHKASSMLKGVLPCPDKTPFF